MLPLYMTKKVIYQKQVKMVSTPDISFFLDTTLTFSDPFFKHNFNRQLIKTAEFYSFPIYMSKVVFDETRNKYEQNLSKHLTDLDNAYTNFGKYVLKTPPKLEFDKAQLMQEFDEFYRDLINKGTIKIIEISNNILPTLIERSIKRIKPFTDKKQEFRDATTWLSYANVAEDKELEHCYLITNNKNDYCDDNGNVHQDLAQDSKRFIIYDSARALFEKSEVIKPLITSVKLQTWVDAKKITDEFVLSLIQDQAYDEIEDVVKKFISETDVRRLVDDVYESGYCDCSGMEIHDLCGLNIEIVNDEIIITGEVSIGVNLGVYFYNPIRDSRNEDKYALVGYGDAYLSSEFSFTISTEENIEHFELDKPTVNEKADLGLDNYDDRY